MLRQGYFDHSRDNNLAVQFNAVFLEQFENLLKDGSVTAETWFWLFQFIWERIHALENPMRRSESRAWLNAFKAQAETLAKQERANRVLRNRALSSIGYSESLVLSPAVGEVVDCVVAAMMPNWAAWICKFKLSLHAPHQCLCSAR